MKKIISIVMVLLIIWQLFSWLEFVPTKEDGDLFVELSKMYYYWTVIPFSLLGIGIAVYFLRKLSSLTVGMKILSWTLLVVSICSIPPIFKIARYIFYPFLN